MRISCAVSFEAASVAASLGGIVSGRFRVGGAVKSVAEQVQLLQLLGHWHGACLACLELCCSNRCAISVEASHYTNPLKAGILGSWADRSLDVPLLDGAARGLDLKAGGSCAAQAKLENTLGSHCSYCLVDLVVVD
jgi:hypothetical protein